jgi:hypothetical protein
VYRAGGYLSCFDVSCSRASVVTVVVSTQPLLQSCNSSNTL